MVSLYDSRNTLTTTGYIIYTLILIVTYVYAIVLSAGYVPTFVDKIQKGCVINCYDDQCRKKSSYGRGDNLLIGDPVQSAVLKGCRYTTWNLIHGLYFAVLTLIFPSLWPVHLGGSVLFEYYEYAYLDCHDINDLPSNLLGVMLGYAISPYKPI